MNRIFQEHKKGLVGTVIFHVILIFVLVFFGLSTPLPLPAEEGILINFGYEPDGFGATDPNPDEYEPLESEPISQQVSQTNPESNSNQEVEEVHTQDFEESVKVDSKKEIKVKEKTKEQIEKERIEKEILEKERIEIEKRRVEAEKEAQKKAEEERRKKEINDRFKNSFGQGQNQDPTNSSGQGLTQGSGNQGQETGDPTSNNYGSGQGLGDEGVSYSLDGRGKISLPKPVLKKDEYGTVVVTIRVNAAGDVVTSNVNPKGTTTTSNYLWGLAKEAALLARFTAKPNSPDQFGSITYRFVLE
jgi:colicin import membrane protein